ncbi:MAG TPA: peptidase S8, partial [Pedobacter sp.]
MRKMKKNVLSAVAVLILISSAVFAQQMQKQPKPNWYNLDLKADGMFGISIDKSYKELLKGKKATPVIVAVIDGGLDIEHEDLKQVVWTNPKEIPGNGKDDDKNGYIDDIHGWNFLGTSKESFEFDNEQIVREIRKYKARFGDKDSTWIAKKDLPDYRQYKIKVDELAGKLKKLNEEIESTTRFFTDVNAILKKMGKENPSLEDFKKFIPSNN